MHWNCDSISNKIVEFYDFMIQNNIHVACLSETHLKPHRHIHRHPDFCIYRLDRTDRPMGGVAIVVRKSISHRLLPHTGMKLIECIGIELNLESRRKLHIYSVYLPSKTSPAVLRQHYINDLRTVTRQRRDANYFICGDFNSRHYHWNCRSNNLAGNLLYQEYVDDNFMILFPNTHTHVPNDTNKQPSTIDLIVTNSVLPISTPVGEFLSSDHEAVTTEIELSSPSILNNARRVRAYRKADWEQYRFSIANRLNTSNLDLQAITNTEQIDSMVRSFTDLILRVQDFTVPLELPNRYAIELTPEIRALIIVRRAKRREWQSTRNPRCKTVVNLLKRIIQEKVNELRNGNWSRMLENLPEDDNKRSLWRLSRYLKNKSREIPPLSVDDKILLTEEEKTKALADKFEEFHQNTLAGDDPNHTNEVTSQVTRYLADQASSVPAYPTPEEVHQYIRKLKSSKAPGHDRVHNNLLKQLPYKAIIYLNFIISACFKLCYFPTEWKTAKVVPIKKPDKDAAKTTSYRPISLLSSIAKILERAILSRLNVHTNDFNIIPSAQHGFRSNHSTTHQLHRVITHMRTKLRSRSTSGVIFFDIEKAFDRIWHAGLLYKLIKFHYPRYLIKIVASFLQQRRFNVAINSTLSTTRNIPFGVPQGAVLSPTLYNIYTSDAPQPPDCLVAFYADDTAIISSSPRWVNVNNNLQLATNLYQHYYNRWKIKLNVDKTQALLVTRRRTRELPELPFLFNDHEIEWESVCKYLGVMIDRKLTMSPHIDYVIGKTQRAIRLLYPLISRNSKLNVHNKLLLFKLALRPIYTYACPIVITAAKTHISKLQRLQNKLLKMIRNLPWYTRTSEVHDAANVEMVIDFMRRLEMKFNENDNVR